MAELKPFGISKVKQGGQKMANENRLIEADALREHKFPEMDSLYDYGWNDAIDAIMENAHTVDAVEVVRCKDCEYAKDMLPLANATDHEMGVCTVRKEDGIEFTVWGHHFCSYGERREA